MFSSGMSITKAHTLSHAQQSVHSPAYCMAPLRTQILCADLVLMSHCITVQAPITDAIQADRSHKTNQH